MSVWSGPGESGVPELGGEAMCGCGHGEARHKDRLDRPCRCLEPACLCVGFVAVLVI